MRGSWKVAFVVCWALGCSGKSANSGECANSAACGGNLVGTWEVVSSCVSSDSTQPNPSCPGETSRSQLDVTGTMTFNADGTYSTNLTVNGGGTVTVPKSCLAQANVTRTCDQLQQNVTANSSSSNVASVSCQTSADQCTCAVVLNAIATSETGTYVTSAAGLLTTTTTATGKSDTSDYCVQDKTLTISDHPGASMAGMPTTSGTITLRPL